MPLRGAELAHITVALVLLPKKNLGPLEHAIHHGKNFPLTSEQYANKHEK